MRGVVEPWSSQGNRALSPTPLLFYLIHHSLTYTPIHWKRGLQLRIQQLKVLPYVPNNDTVDHAFVCMLRFRRQPDHARVREPPDPDSEPQTAIGRLPGVRAADR